MTHPVVKIALLVLVAVALGVVSGGVQALVFNVMEDRRVTSTAGKDAPLHLNPVSLAVSTGVGMVLVTLLMEFGRGVMQ